MIDLNAPREKKEGVVIPPVDAYVHNKGKNTQQYSFHHAACARDVHLLNVTLRASNAWDMFKLDFVIASRRIPTRFASTVQLEIHLCRGQTTCILK